MRACTLHFSPLLLAARAMRAVDGADCNLNGREDTFDLRSGIGLGAPTYFETGDSPRGLALPDIDGDGDLDAVFAAVGPGIYVVVNDGGGHVRDNKQEVERCGNEPRGIARATRNWEHFASCGSADSRSTSP